jgi:hypothetical protein
MSSGIDANTVLTTVRQYLNKMKIPFRAEGEQNLLIAWNMKGIDFPASITVTNGYVFLYAIIMLRKELKNADLQQVYELLLRASHNLPEVAFDIDDFGNIGTGQEIPVNGLTFEVFKSELDAIPTAILYFLERVAPECNIQLPDDRDEST